MPAAGAGEVEIVRVGPPILGTSLTTACSMTSPESEVRRVRSAGLTCSVSAALDKCLL